MSDNGGGWVPMVQKSETRKGGVWEDIKRPLAQTFAHWLAIIWQLIVTVATASAWAYTWSESRRWEMPRNSDVALLLTASVWFLSPFAFGAIFTSRLIRNLIGKIAGYDETELSAGFQVILVAVATVLFNVLFNNAVVFAVMNTRIIPILITIICAASWASFTILRQSMRQELLEQAATNSEGYQIKSLELEWEREKFYHANSDVEERAVEVAQRDAVRFVPVNHGSARAIGIGQQTFKPDELALMSRFISEWTSRGTARAQWTTDNGHGWRLSDPQWDKFTSALRAVGILDQRNHPTINAADAISTLNLPPYPTEIGRGDAENAGVSRPVPSHPEILEQAIKKLPRANRT